MEIEKKMIAKIQTKKKNLVYFLLISMFLTFLPLEDSNTPTTNTSETFKPKPSGRYILSYIHVNEIESNNWSYTADTFAWCSGGGTLKDPYIIQDCVIDATSSPTKSGILIENSKNAYFVIQNCSAFNSDGDFTLHEDVSGIEFVNTHNGTIENCSMYDNDNYGITLNSCTNITIVNSTIFDNHHAIWMPQSIDNFVINNTIINNDGDALNMVCYSAYPSDSGNVVEGNIINNNDQSIQVLGGCNYNFISNNTIVGNTLAVSLDSMHNIFSNNFVNNTSASGVYLSGSYNTIVNNTINYCTSGYALWVRNWGNKFINNTMMGNDYGIRISTGGNHIISNNVIKNSSHYGIRIGWSEGNLVLNNTIRYSNTTGILLEHSFNNEIKYNTITDSTDYCIYVDAECSDNIFEGNSCLPFYEIINNGQYIVGFPIEFVVLMIGLTSVLFYLKKNKLNQIK